MRQFLIFLGFCLLSSSLFAEAAPSNAQFFQRGTQAVVRITLAEGYKTYWRIPGEAGIAPEFGWEGSQNLGHAEVTMPGPKRFDAPESEVIGYADQVEFLVNLKPILSDQVILPRLQLQYAICKDLCIPVAVNLQPQAAPDGLIEAVAAQMPETFMGASVRQIGSGLEVSLPFSADDMFIEQDQALAYFYRPQSLGGWRYLVPAEGDISGLVGKSLQLTIISGRKTYVTNASVQ